MNRAELTGQARTHLATLADLQCLVHVQAAKPLLNLRHAALREGIDLAAASGFRDFSHQLAIWNGKFNGERPMYDASGGKLDFATLAPRERVEAILLWSALPGASRHHWGTDLDLIDRNAAGPGYEIKLIPEEYAAGGPMAVLDQWLEIHAPRFGFFRPFKGVRSGVQAEPWHLSFAPVAERARRDLSPEMLRSAIDGAPLMGKEVVLEQLDALHARYVAAIDLP